jgi:hypothetical protein
MRFIAKDYNERKITHINTHTQSIEIERGEEHIPVHRKRKKETVVKEGCFVSNAIVMGLCGNMIYNIMFYTKKLSS